MGIVHQGAVGAPEKDNRLAPRGRKEPLIYGRARFGLSFYIQTVRGDKKALNLPIKVPS
jgi:hypothetical protein